MARPAKLHKAQYEALAAFRHALRRFIHFSETAAAGAGITPQQHQALLAIKGFPGRDHVTVGELADRLQLRHHSAVGLVDRLVAEKLVSRVSGRKDRRQVLVHLTHHGEDILERLSAAHGKELKRIAPEFGQLLERFNNQEKQYVRECAPSPLNGRFYPSDRGGKQEPQFIAKNLCSLAYFLCRQIPFDPARRPKDCRT